MHSLSPLAAVIIIGNADSVAVLIRVMCMQADTEEQRETDKPKQIPTVVSSTEI